MKTPTGPGSTVGTSSAETLIKGALKNADALGKLVDGVREIADAVRVVAVQTTERNRIEAAARVDIARVQAVRDVLLTYLDRSFDERRTNFAALFERLDAAMAQGNVQVASATLDAVVKLAGSSPFKDLADVASARTALGDKAKDWEF